jgi:hypothetical protein
MSPSNGREPWGCEVPSLHLQPVLCLSDSQKVWGEPRERSGETTALYAKKPKHGKNPGPVTAILRSKHGSRKCQ